MGRPRKCQSSSVALGCFTLVALVGCQATISLHKEIGREPVRWAENLIRQRAECDGKQFWTEKWRCVARFNYSERACAEAFSELGRTYYYRRGYDAYPLYRLLNACGRAYCPRLGAPRPQLCAALPVGPNPAGWYDKVDALLFAIDVLEKRWVSSPALRVGPDHGYCRVDRHPHKKAPEVTLWLRRESGRMHVRATGGAEGAWSFDSFAGEAPRPIINALYERGYRGEIAFKVENVVPAKAFSDLVSALTSAGWCKHHTTLAKHDDPGGLSCPNAGNRPLRRAQPFTDDGMLGTTATVRVTPTALYYKGKLVVKLEGGRVPGTYITDGPQGHLIHPLRKAILADHPQPGISDSIRIAVTPGMTLSSYLWSSISYSANQALAQATRSKRSVDVSVSCQ